MLLNIQFLRFSAAMLVVLYHTAAQVTDSQSAIHGLFFLGQAFGFAGVDVFFVISGFIMAYTTLEKSGIHNGTVFARKRAARIFSGHWPFFMLTLVVFYWTRNSHFIDSNLIASFFLWPQPLNRTLLEITWTLSFELYFYLLFSVLIWLIPSNKRMLVCTLIAAFLLALSLYQHFVVDAFGLDKLYLMSFKNYFLASPFILEFFSGSVLAYYLHKKPAGWSTLWVVAGCALFLASGAINVKIYGGEIEQGFHVVPRVLWFGSASLMILTGLVRLENRSINTPSRFSLLAGGASYAIYLSHILILVAAKEIGIFSFLSALPFALSAIGYILLMALVPVYSILHYQKLEKPLHHVFKRWTRVSGS